MFEERRLESLIRKPTRTVGGEAKEPNRRPPTAKKSTPPDQTDAELYQVPGVGVEMLLRNDSPQCHAYRGATE